MPCSDRLFLVALFLSSLAAFAQGQGSNVQKAPDFRTPPAATPSESWRILSKPDSDKDQGLILITPEMGPEGVIVFPDGPLAAGTTCYAIRSYVVARDSKDSDSVHPIGHSTCMPAPRYRLKPADDYVSLER